MFLIKLTIERSLDTNVLTRNGQVVENFGFVMIVDCILIKNRFRIPIVIIQRCFYFPVVERNLNLEKQMNYLDGKISNIFPKNFKVTYAVFHLEFSFEFNRNCCSLV